MDLMSERQWKRWDVIGRVNAERLTMVDGARSFENSLRQLRRIRGWVAEEGKEALFHGNRGRPPVNRTAESIRERVVALRRGKYTGFNEQHFTEKLREESTPVSLSVWTVRRILRGAGIA